MKSLFLTSAFLISTSLFATEIKLATITSDSDKDVTEFFVEVDSAKAIDSFRFMTTTPDGRIEKDDTFPIETVIDTGVTLLEKKGRQILKMKSGGLTPEAGGSIILDYLFNGVRGTRKSMKLNLVKSVKGFALETTAGAPVTKMRIIANRVRVLGPVGISHITTSAK